MLLSTPPFFSPTRKKSEFQGHTVQLYTGTIMYVRGNPRGLISCEGLGFVGPSTNVWRDGHGSVERDSDWQIARFVNCEFDPPARRASRQVVGQRGPGAPDSWTAALRNGTPPPLRQRTLLCRSTLPAGPRPARGLQKHGVVRAEAGKSGPRGRGLCRVARHPCTE